MSFSLAIRGEVGAEDLDVRQHTDHVCVPMHCMHESHHAVGTRLKFNNVTLPRVLDGRAS